MVRYLQPWKQHVAITGRISYHGPSQAWCLIRLKKDFLQEFQELKEKQGEFFYEFLLYYHWEILEQHLQEMKKEGKVPPLLFWVGKGEIQSGHV